MFYEWDTICFVSQTHADNSFFVVVTQTCRHVDFEHEHFYRFYLEKEIDDLTLNRHINVLM